MKGLLVRCIAFSLLVGLVTGCSGKRAGSRISGKVTLKGQPITAGFVRLYTGNDVVGIGTIQPDGNYNVTAVPDGSYTVAVVQTTGSSLAKPEPTPVPVGKAGTPPAKGVAPAAAPKAAPPAPVITGNGPTVPDKYKDAAKSGLKVEVSGNTSYNIELQ